MMRLNHWEATRDESVLASAPIDTKIAHNQLPKCNSNQVLLKQRKKTLLKCDHYQHHNHHHHHQVPKLFNYAIILLNACLLLTTIAIPRNNRLASTGHSSDDDDEEDVAVADQWIDSFSLIARGSNRTSYFIDRDANQSTSATKSDDFHHGTKLEPTKGAKKTKKSGKGKSSPVDDEVDFTLDPDFKDVNEVADKYENQPNKSDESESDRVKKFDDFDDFKALNLSQFYLQEPDVPTESNENKTTQKIISQFYHNGDEKMGLQTSDAATKKTSRFKKDKSPAKSKPSDKDKQQRQGKSKPKEPEAQQQQDPDPVVISQQQLAASSCAMQRESGQCITYQMVEWAIEQAKRALNFQLSAARRATDNEDEADDEEASAEEELNSLEPSENLINSVGELNEWTTRMLARQFSLTPDEINFDLEQIDIRRTSLWQTCPRIYRQPLARTCFAASPLLGQSGGDRIAADQLLLQQRYRSHTGQCNNLMEPRLGSSYMPFVRMLQPDYAEAVGWPRRSASGSSLPPARLVALNLHPDFDSPTEDHSMLFANWGQLINHDLAMASNARDSTGHDISCCRSAAVTRRSGTAQTSAAQMTNELDMGQRICMPIELAPDDPIYGPVGQRCHEFKRSLAALRPGCSLGPRTQLNTISSYVDASFVYGSTNSVSVSLRSTSSDNGAIDGQMAMWDYFNGRAASQRASSLPLKPLLPPQLRAPDEECVGRRRGLYCFRSGDTRTNQQIPLAVLHTLHTRHHNRLASGLRVLNPHWSAGRVYEEARHIHIALVQHILLSEYLPLLLGPKQCKAFELTESGPNEYWDHYNAALNPGVSQEFAAAAFRQGHSSVPSHVFRFDVRTRQARRVYPLRSTYFQPWPLFEPGAMDEFVVGLSEMPAQSVDPFVSIELSGHLLQAPSAPVGLDLIAINIQRGRDQGVASYNTFREFCGLGRFDGFEQLAGVMSNRSAQTMSQLYETVDDIDLFSGGLSEFPLAGAQVGPTFACIIGKQFQTLRAADRYWFESSAGPHAFSADQLNSIKQFTLAKLICSNSDQIDLIQALAMRQPHPILNPLQACATLPDVQLGLWLEPQQPLVVVQPSAQASTAAASTATTTQSSANVAGPKISDKPSRQAEAAADEEDDEDESEELEKEEQDRVA